MAKMKDLAPDYVGNEGKVFGWDTSAGMVTLLAGSQEVMIGASKPITVADAEALMLALSAAVLIGRGKAPKAAAA